MDEKGMKLQAALPASVLVMMVVVIAAVLGVAVAMPERTTESEC